MEKGEDSQQSENRFSLKDGTLLTNKKGRYVTKAVELEKRMRSLELSACTQGEDSLTLNVAKDIILPTINDVNLIDFTLNDQPVITEQPSVIGGIIQTKH